MSVEIKPHKWEEHGDKYAADCFPFINEEPRYDIDCQNCEHYREGAEYCAGWEDDKANAPLFCGPICPKFSLDNSL